MAPRALSPTQKAIRQDRPFSSPSQETVVALMLAADRVRWPFERLLAESACGLTLQQFNVLRILRGAGEAGLPTLEIGERMVERTPGITRLVDRLEEKKLIERRRSTTDRRQVVVRITKGGRDALASLDADIDRLDSTVLSMLGPTELKSLLRLLERIHGG